MNEHDQDAQLTQINYRRANLNMQLNRVQSQLAVVQAHNNDDTNDGMVETVIHLQERCARLQSAIEQVDQERVTVIAQARADKPSQWSPHADAMHKHMSTGMGIR